MIWWKKTEKWCSTTGIHISVFFIERTLTNNTAGNSLFCGCKNESIIDYNGLVQTGPSKYQFYFESLPCTTLDAGHPEPYVVQGDPQSTLSKERVGRDNAQIIFESLILAQGERWRRV